VNDLRLTARISYDGQTNVPSVVLPICEISVGKSYEHNEYSQFAANIITMEILCFVCTGSNHKSAAAAVVVAAITAQMQHCNIVTV